MPKSGILGLESVEAKLRRAHHHLTDLTTSLTELGRNHKPELIPKSDSQAYGWLSTLRSRSSTFRTAPSSETSFTIFALP